VYDGILPRGPVERMAGVPFEDTKTVATGLWEGTPPAARAMASATSSGRVTSGGM
jgi:hypothetical protein